MATQSPFSVPIRRQSSTNCAQTFRHGLAGQPHNLDIAPRLGFQPAARRDAVQVAVDEQFEQHCGVIAGPPRPRGGGAGESKTLQIELFNEEIDNADEAILTDPVVQQIRKSTDWPRSTPSMKPAMPASD